MDMGKVARAWMIAAAFAVFAPAAHARDFNCDASAARITVGSSATVEPLTANRGSSTCKTVKSQTSGGAGGVNGGILVAQTTRASDSQADATGGLGQLSVSLSALSGLPIPTLDAVNQIPAVPVPIPLAGQLLGLPSTINVDIRPAVNALVTGVTSGDLLDVQGSVANAHARCVNGTPQLSGDTTVLGVRVLGQTLPTDAIVNQALTLYDGQTIDPSKLDLTKVVLPPGLSFTDPTVGAILQAAVQPVISALPPITLPASLINVSLKPSSQTVADGGLTQQGLSLSLSLVGQNVISAVLGEARVSDDSVHCTIQTSAGEVAPLNTVTKQALSCSRRRLALIDVIDAGHYVKLYGAADLSLAGKRIAIRSLADGKIVARPRVNSAGLFTARAKLPPARWRYSNRARYMAVHGKDRSLNLKLHRRMVFTHLTSRHGKVILTGVVTKPWTRPISSIVLRQRVTCHRQKTVARLRPDRRGHFRVVLRAPKNGDVGVYRATTMVGYPGGPDFRTYTLPGLVRFAR